MTLNPLCRSRKARDSSLAIVLQEKELRDSPVVANARSIHLDVTTARIGCIGALHAIPFLGG